jgi:hypothetical protein
VFHCVQTVFYHQKAVFQKSSFRVLRQCFQKVTNFTFW